MSGQFRITIRDRKSGIENSFTLDEMEYGWRIEGMITRSGIFNLTGVQYLDNRNTQELPKDSEND